MSVQSNMLFDWNQPQVDSSQFFFVFLSEKNVICYMRKDKITKNIILKSYFMVKITKAKEKEKRVW